MGAKRNTPPPPLSHQAERAARFHVDLVGWHRNGAEEDVAAYIGRAVGNPPEVVAPLLQNLPFRASFKAPRERAKRMQRTFFQMGADVELVPVDQKPGGLGESDLKELPFRPYWPPQPEFEGEDIQSLKSFSMETRTLLTGSGASPRRPSGVALAMGGLVMLVIVLGGALLLERNGSTEEVPDEVATVAAAVAASAVPVVVFLRRGRAAWVGGPIHRPLAGRVFVKGHVRALSERALATARASLWPYPERELINSPVMTR